MWLMTRRIGTSSIRCATIFSSTAVMIAKAAEISRIRSPASIMPWRSDSVSVVISISSPACRTGWPMMRMMRFSGVAIWVSASPIAVQKGWSRRS